MIWITSRKDLKVILHHFVAQTIGCAIQLFQLIVFIFAFFGIITERATCLFLLSTALWNHFLMSGQSIVWCTYLQRCIALHNSLIVANSSVCAVGLTVCLWLGPKSRRPCPIQTHTHSSSCIEAFLHRFASFLLVATRALVVVLSCVVAFHIRNT